MSRTVNAQANVTVGVGSIPTPGAKQRACGRGPVATAIERFDSAYDPWEGDLASKLRQAHYIMVV